jgi:hypothetical protein
MVIGESDAPCLVLVENASQIKDLTIKLFLSDQWDRDTSKDTREYISALIEHISSISMNDIHRLLAGIQESSVGPLRLGSSETCNEEELPRLLEKVFGQCGFTALPVNNSID